RAPQCPLLGVKRTSGGSAQCPLLTQSGHSASNFAVTHKAVLTQDEHGRITFDLVKRNGALSPGDQEPTCSRAMRRAVAAMTWSKRASLHQLSATTGPGHPLSDGPSWRSTLSLGASNGCGGLAAEPWPRTV